MAQKEYDVSAIPSGKKYLVAWVTVQVIGNLPWLVPWVSNQIKAAQQADATLAAPDASTIIFAGIALLVSTVMVFVHKVWRELEADAVKGTSDLIKAAPGMAWELLGRCGDALWVLYTRFFIRWGFTRKYLAELRYRYGLFNDKGLGLINANRLDLDKVYVELKASSGVNLNNPRLNPVSRQIRERAPLWEHLRTLRAGFALSIIGAPGSGKTTLLHHVLLTYAHGRQWRCRMRFRMPIFIELRKIAPQLPSDPRKFPDLPKLIETLWKNDSRSAEITKQMPKGWLAAHLRSGRCLLLWDGLDEVADPVQRRLVRDWLESSVISHVSYRANVSIVTARPAGYRAAPLDHAQVLEVQPFDWEDTKRFIHQWYHATEVVSSGNLDNAITRRRAAEDGRALLSCLQDTPKLGDLSVNPLLLTMICMVHRYHGALPGSRSQLYDEICQVLLERWRQQRGMEDNQTSQQKLEVLRPLALWMMRNRAKDIDEGDMLSVIAEPLARIGVPPGQKAALAFIHHLRDNSGLWLERELKSWAFAHLSFQEHLCADAWAKEEWLCPEDWASLLPDPWWRETLLLYAVKATDATPLAQIALDGDAACRSLGLQLLDEKINLAATTRQRMERTLVQALTSRDEGVFLPAAEAWLMRQQERSYHRLDDERQINGWVTQGEYQAFLLSLPTSERTWAVPLHWRSLWFSGNPELPVRGLSGRQAQAFCGWLNRLFPAMTHRLPLDDQEAGTVLTAPQDMLAWLKNDGGRVYLQSAKPSWLANHAVRMPARCDFDVLARVSVLDLGLHRARSIDLAIVKAFDCLRGHSSDNYLVLALDRAFAFAFDLDHASASSSASNSALDRALDLLFFFSAAFDRSHANGTPRDIARAVDHSRVLARDFTRAVELARTHAFFGSGIV